MFAEDTKIDKKITVCHSFSVLCKYVVTIVYIILIHKTTLFRQMWRKEKNRHIIIHFSDIQVFISSLHVAVLRLNTRSRLATI